MAWNYQQVGGLNSYSDSRVEIRKNYLSQSLSDMLCNSQRKFDIFSELKIHQVMTIIV